MAGGASSCWTRRLVASRGRGEAQVGDRLGRSLRRCVEVLRRRQRRRAVGPRPCRSFSERLHAALRRLRERTTSPRTGRAGSATWPSLRRRRVCAVANCRRVAVIVRTQAQVRKLANAGAGLELGRARPVTSAVFGVPFLLTKSATSVRRPRQRGRRRPVGVTAWRRRAAASAARAAKDSAVATGRARPRENSRRSGRRRGRRAHERRTR